MTLFYLHLLLLASPLVVVRTLIMWWWPPYWLHWLHSPRLCSGLAIQKSAQRHGEVRRVSNHISSFFSNPLEMDKNIFLIEHHDLLIKKTFWGHVMRSWLNTFNTICLDEFDHDLMIMSLEWWISRRIIPIWGPLNWWQGLLWSITRDLMVA